MPKGTPTTFEQKLAKALWPYPAEERYLVGVSGGRDSVALLHGLVAAGYGRLVVCHLNHGLRAREARKDADFVRRLADEMKLPAVFGEAKVRELARTKKLSLETAAREARYGFFASVSARRRCRTLLLAHQADDQAETFLFNLLRGAGPAGLAAMATESQRAAGRNPLKIVRPLLAVWRSEIDEYLGVREISWREDATNHDPTHATRNRLRVEILPLLSRAMDRDVKPALWRAADILGAEERWLSELCAGWETTAEKLEVGKLRALPLAMQRRVVRSWLAAQGIPQVGYREVEAALSLLDHAGPAKINLLGDRHVRRRSGELFVE